RGHVEAMIHDDGSARIIEIGAGEYHDTGGWRLHYRPRGRGDVDTEMRSARIAIIPALAAVNPADRSQNRPDEIIEHGFVGNLLETGCIDQCDFVANAFENFRCGCNVLVF